MHRVRKEELRPQAGVTLILVLVTALGFLVLSVVSLDMTREHRVTQVVQREAFSARMIAESGAAQALARIKEAGVVAPFSGSGTDPSWLGFSNGEFLYYTLFDAPNQTSTIRSWGRVAADAVVSGSTVAPDDPAWDPSGYLVQGVELVVKARKFIPETPLFFGNGGIERPLGGFAWTGGADPNDPSTWGSVTSNPSSWQTSSIPFEASALDHPVDFLTNGGTPVPATSNPHPFKLWASQNLIGQHNIESWFQNSAGAGNDPTVNLSPPPTSSYFDTSDNLSPDYPYPIDPEIPDVQTFAHELWNTYHDDPDATLLTSGNHSGTYGDLSDPGVTFVTGSLLVPAGQTFRGAGILVIRDDYDPNVDTNNRPNRKAYVNISGNLEWTGLVVIAGWAPTIETQNGSSSTIVGALFGEDSVQSGGEISLDSATIIMKLRDQFRVLYSNSLFTSGGIIHPFLPGVKKEVVGSRKI